MTPPAVLAYHDRTTRQLLVYCEHERVWHRHGDAVMGGHRVAHCSCSGSPTRSTGYVLAVIGEAPESVLKAAATKRRGHRCPSCALPSLSPRRLPCPSCPAGAGESCHGMKKAHWVHRARRRLMAAETAELVGAA